MSKEISYFAIEDEVYHKNFHLVVNVPRNKFCKWIAKVHKKDPALYDAKAAVVWNYANHYYVWVETFDWSIDSQSTLVHELSHFVDFVLTDAGILINKKNTEVRAYYFEYIFKKVWTALSPLHHITERE